jgi:undecaprenyl-diphosphatase
LTTFATVAARELDVGPVGRLGLRAATLAVGASRVVLGVHYPSDVVSGLLLGRAVAALWPGRPRRGRR